MIVSRPTTDPIRALRSPGLGIRAWRGALASLGVLLLAAPLHAHAAAGFGSEQDAKSAKAINELGRLNGLALACGHPDVAARIGKAVVARFERTRANGAAFEQATQDAFITQGRGASPCPARAELAVGLEVVLLALPSSDNPAPSVDPGAESRAAPPATGGSESLPPNPRYLLQDMHGRAILDQDFHGRFQLLTFGYTFCPDICPTTLAEMALVLGRLGERAERLQPLFVSVDPARDTLAVLKTYTAFFDPRILGATGSPELLSRSAETFGVRFAKVAGEAGDPNAYAIDHTAGMFLLAPDGQMLARFANATPVAKVVERIVAEMDARPAGARAK